MRARQIMAFTTMLFISIGAIMQPVTAAEKPSISAASAILIEKNSGRVLYSKNADEKLPIASTTKIMTAICAIENGGELDRIIEISDSAAGVEGSSMYLEKGEKMTLRELLYGLMLSSGNDAAVAIAQSNAESTEKFAEQMNKKALEIGATSTNFTNPNGLPDENHYSTARDMAIITAYALSNPTFAEIVASKSYKIEGEGKAYPRILTNHNKLLGMYEGCIGVKTGFTKSAGRCLVSAAQRDGMTLVCVTLNAPNDWNDHTALFDFGFEEYDYVKLASADVPVCAAEIIGTLAGAIPVYPERDVYFPLAQGEGYIPEIEIYPELSAPIAAGEKVGRISFVSNGNSKSAVPLISSGEISLVVKNNIESASVIKNIGMGFAENLKNFLIEWMGIFA